MPQLVRKAHRLAMTALVIMPLTFVGLTAITGPTQQANATAQSDYYSSIAANWNTATPVTISFCGYTWDIVGINDGTNNVGIGTTTDGRLPVGNVTLLLDKSNTIVPRDWYNYNYSGGGAYNVSLLLGIMNGSVADALLSCQEYSDIVPRNLTDVGVTNQYLWPLSASEAAMFSDDSFRLFPESPHFWWTRSQGSFNNMARTVNGLGWVTPNSSTNTENEVRPALFLKLSSSIFLTTLSQFAVNFDLQSGGGTIDTKYIYRDTPTALPNYSGTKSGYTFEGWDTDSSADTVEYTDGQQVTNLTTTGSTTTLYAVWKPKPVASVSLNLSSTTVTVGATTQLEATLLPADLLNSAVTWYTSDNSLATVNSAGLVTTLTVGDVTVTAKSDADQNKFATATVHIVPLIIPVSSVSVAPSSVTLTAGQTKQLSVTVLPTYADNKLVVWSSSNNSVATVSSNGKVTAKTAGTVTIKATAQDGSGVVGKSVITVKPKPVSTKAKKARGSITFIWGSSGFLTTVEIYYRVKGTSKWKVVRVSGADRKKIKLKRKKTYQFQLRGCKTVKGKNYYSAWTKKTVKS